MAVVTGSSSGIGRAASLALARAGYAAYATMRDESKGEGLLEEARREGLDVRVARLDVDSDDSVDSAVAAVLEGGGGRIDALVNSAGCCAIGAAEDVPISEYRAQLETNFLGAVRTIRRIAPAMRARGGGTIVNVSSVAGRIGFPCTSAHACSKFALEGLGECLRHEMGRFGVRVVTVEPGVTKTGFLGSARSFVPGGSPYAELAGRVAAGARMMVELGTEPGEVAAAIAGAVAADDPPPRLEVGKDAAMFLGARREKTDAEFERYVAGELPG